MPLNVVFLRPQKWVSTKTLLLKHYYRREGKGSEKTIRKRVPKCFKPLSRRLKIVSAALL